MSSTTAIRLRKVASVVFWVASVGLAVWANERVVDSEITSPAVAIAVKKTRRIAPMARPMMTSRKTSPPSSLIVGGTCGRVGATIGVTTSESRNAKARRTRTGVGVSPMPGMVMISAPTRANTRPPVKTCWTVA